MISNTHISNTCASNDSAMQGKNEKHKEMYVQYIDRASQFLTQQSASIFSSDGSPAAVQAEKVWKVR